jgi:steroid 5-alpha reductase family enzyme
MAVLYLEALAGIALSLSVLMGLAWMVQQRTGNCGWADTIRTFSVGLVGAGSALWPVAGAARYRDYQSRTSTFFPLPPQKGVVT